MIPQEMPNRGLDLNTFPRYREITVLMWNIRDVGSNDFIPHHWSLVQIHNSGIVVLLETKVGEELRRS